MGHGEVTRAQLERVTMRGVRYRYHLRLISLGFLAAFFSFMSFLVGVYVGRNYHPSGFEKAPHHGTEKPPSAD